MSNTTRIHIRYSRNAAEPINGYLYASEIAGIGVEIDREVAAEFPVMYRPHEWTQKSPS
ncbi:hypothetical protein O9992_23840 [Vibrio lentus]|nr:hypothetical protein [Vibrio lentus]